MANLMDLEKLLEKKNFRVKRLSPFHFRVEGEIDIWMPHGKWHDLTFGDRGQKPLEQIPYFLQNRLTGEGAVEREKVKSQMIASYAYDANTQVLEIELVKRKEGEPPKVYRYSNFDAKMYEEFLAAESKGRFFLERIKGNPAIPFERVKEEEKSEDEASFE